MPTTSSCTLRALPCRPCENLHLFCPCSAHVGDRFHALRARVDASLQNGNRSCSHPAFHENPLKLDICCGASDYFPAIAQQPPIHTTSRAARAPTRLDQNLVCDWGWVCCETHIARLVVLANPISRAIGTPLEWPEAKKVASHVRSWGIEV
jgi:hypothetical protein